MSLQATVVTRLQALHTTLASMGSCHGDNHHDLYHANGIPQYPTWSQELLDHTTLYVSGYFTGTFERSDRNCTTNLGYWLYTDKEGHRYSLLAELKGYALKWTLQLLEGIRSKSLHYSGTKNLSTLDAAISLGNLPATWRCNYPPGPGTCRFGTVMPPPGIIISTHQTHTHMLGSTPFPQYPTWSKDLYDHPKLYVSGYFTGTFERSDRNCTTNLGYWLYTDKEGHRYSLLAELKGYALKWTLQLVEGIRSKSLHYSGTKNLSTLDAAISLGNLPTNWHCSYPPAPGSGTCPYGSVIPPPGIIISTH